MARVTSKRQVTIPKAIADRYGIAAGDEIRFEPAGEAIRVHRAASGSEAPDLQRRLELFDRATRRQGDRQQGRGAAASGDPGWRREDLYGRGSAR